MSIKERRFADCYDLHRLKYFTLDERGRLVARPEEVGQVIDFHTHLGLSFLAGPKLKLNEKREKVEYFFPYRDLPVDLDVYSAFCFTPQAAKKTAYECIRSAWTSKGFMGTHTVPNMLEDMDRLGITHSIILAIDYPFGLSANSEAFLDCAAAEKRFVPYASVHPYSSDKSQRIDGYVGKGAVGIKLHPAQLLYKANNRRLWEIYEKCDKSHIPVFFHSGHSPISPAWAKDLPDLKHFREPLEEFPDLIFVFGHSGIEQYRMIIEYGKKHERVYAEVSGQPPGRIKELADGLGSERVLFGSDWPFYCQELPLAKALIATEGDRELREKFLYRNAQRLLEETGFKI